MDIEQLLTVDDAERLAEQVVAPEAWSYIVGGAGDERTLRWNREAFSRFRLRPRVLVDVSAVTTETTVLGIARSPCRRSSRRWRSSRSHTRRARSPWRAAPRAPGRSCASRRSRRRRRQTSRQPPPDAPRWLQIYVFRDRAVSDEVIEQALESGFSALVLTADLPVYGIRHREAAHGLRGAGGRRAGDRRRARARRETPTTTTRSGCSSRGSSGTTSPSCASAGRCRSS